MGGPELLPRRSLTEANALLVDAQAGIPLIEVWGGEELASVDGLRFVVPVRTINADPNPKYFRHGRGITYLNYVSDKSTGSHGMVVPGTLRDSLFVLDGLLENQTGLEPVEITSDTAGYSDVIFGLFALLGYQFSPRLADAGEARFWRMEKDADYGPLNGISRNRIKPELIADNWDELLRVAGSLKLGTVTTSEFVRTLQGRPGGPTRRPGLGSERRMPVQQPVPGRVGQASARSGRRGRRRGLGQGVAAGPGARPRSRPLPLHPGRVGYGGRAATPARSLERRRVRVPVNLK